MTTNSTTTIGDTLIEVPEETFEEAKALWDRLIGLESDVDAQGKLVYYSPTGCPVATGCLERMPDGRFKLFMGHPVALQQDWMMLVEGT